MTIFEQINDLLKGNNGRIISSSEVKKALKLRFGTNASSIILSDYCYNRINDGIKFNKHILEYINQNTYKYLGENFPYSGKIIHKPKGVNNESVVGEWNNGIKTLFHKPKISRSVNPPKQIVNKHRFGSNNHGKNGDILLPHFDSVNIPILFHSADEIHSLVNRADDVDEARILISKFDKLKKTRVPFFLTLEDFIEILLWKLRGQFNRTAKFRERNSNLNVKIITTAAFSIEHSDIEYETELRLKILTTLSGVEVPVASAIMALCFPEKYAVIDFRGWRQVFGELKKYPIYSVKDYLTYLRIIMQISNNFGVTPQEVDMAIWQRDIEENRN